MDETQNDYHAKVDKKLIIRQRIFFVIISILVIICIMNTFAGKINFILAISGFALSSAVGLLLSRMFKIFWHQDKAKVVSQLDTMGVVLLILYIGIEIFRNWIFGHWLSGPVLTAFGLVVLTGLLFGRYWGTHLKINQVLSESLDSQA